MAVLVREGDFVILDVNGEKLSFVQVTPKGWVELVLLG